MIDPLLDIAITYDFPEVTTYTTIRGRRSKPELNLSSDPRIYSEGQLLGFLLGGEPSGEPATGSSRERVTTAGTSLVAGSAIDSQILNDLFGYVADASAVLGIDENPKLGAADLVRGDRRFVP